VSGSRKSSDVVIIGGGVIGCNIAWELAKAGVHAQVIERRELAREASWASAGIISPPSPRYGSRADLALRSFKQYPALIEEVESITGLSSGFARSGEVELAQPGVAGSLGETIEWQNANGVTAELLDAASLREREPAISDAFAEGIFTPDAGSLILSRMTTALARAAEMRGASIVEHTPVLAIESESGSATGVRTFDGVIPAGTVVIAAGAWSKTLGESLDYRIPTVPVKGQMVAIADPPIPLRSVIAGGGGYFVPRADGTVAIGATEEHGAGFDTNVTLAGVAWLTDVIRNVTPSLVDGRLAATWAGLRPGVEGGEPIIGRLPHLDNVWVATGHFRSGALLAPATAKALANSITSGQIDPILTPFDPARFA